MCAKSRSLQRQSTYGLSDLGGCPATQGGMLQTPFRAQSNGKLLVQAVYSTKLKVANNIYDAVKEEICRESAQWRQQHINFSAYPPSDSTQPYTAMKMSGQDAKQVAQATNL